MGEEEGKCDGGKKGKKEDDGWGRGRGWGGGVGWRVWGRGGGEQE